MQEQEVRIESGEIKLSGTLTLPDGEGAVPGVVLISGSGPIDRNSNTDKMKLRIMSLFAKRLADIGVATLRYDKRGIGASGGDYYLAGHSDHVNDASAATDFLQKHDCTGNERILILGHSEGALIAPQVSTRDEAVSGLILICPTCQDFAELLYAQAKHATEQIEVMPGVSGFITRLICRVTGNPIQQQQQVFDKLAVDDSPVVKVKGRKINAKWFREMLLFDAEAVYRKLHIATLILGGGKDVQCDPSDVLAVRNMIGRQVASYILPNLTHILRADNEPASILRYKQLLKQPVDDALVEHVVDWLQEELSVKAGA